MGRALRGHGFALLRLAGVFGALLGAGWGMPGWLRCRSNRFAVRLGSGLGLLAALLHGFGLAGLWHPALLRHLTLGLAILGAIRWVRAARRPTIRPALAVALAVPLVLGFIVTRLPDTDDDPRTYHFAAPESWLREHKIHAEPLNVNWHMPLAASMLFGAGWAWDDIEGAKLVNLAALVALMAGAGALGRALAPSSPAAPPLAALLAGCTGLGVGQAWQGKDDLVLAAHAALALWGAVTGRTAVALLFLGFACSVKFTGGFVGAGMAAAIVSRPDRNRPNPLFPIPPLPLLLCLFLFPLSGWLLSSFFFVGNPVHPFLSGVFPDLGWGPEYQQALHRVMAILTGAGPVSARAVFDGAWQAWGAMGLGHPLLPVLGTAGIFLVRTRPRWPLAVAVAAGFALWLPTERNPRYLYPFAAVLAAFSGTALARGWDATGRPWRMAARAVAGAALLVPAATALRICARDGVPLLAGRMSRDEFVARRFTTWDTARRWTNDHVPARSSVLLAGEERRLWFHPRVRSGFTVHEPLLWRWSQDAATPGRMRIKARQAGVVVVLHNYMSGEFRSLTRFAGPPWTDRQLAVYRDFAAGWLRPAGLPDRVDRDGGGFIALVLDPAPPGKPWPVMHLPQAEGLAATAWDLAARGDRVRAAAERRRVAARLAGVMVARQHEAIAAEQEGSQEGIRRALAPAVAAGFIGVNALERFGAAAVLTDRTREGLAALSRAWRMTREDSTLAPYAYGLYRRALGHLAAGRRGRAREDLLVAALLAPGQPAIRRELAGLSAPR